MTAERRFQGSVFDVSDARSFARTTARWWGLRAGPVERAVEELARRAVCREDPAFRVVLVLDDTAVRVKVEQQFDATEPEVSNARELLHECRILRLR